MNRSEFINEFKNLQNCALPKTSSLEKNQICVAIASLLNETMALDEILQVYSGSASKNYLSSIQSIHMQYLYCILTNNWFGMKSLYRINSELLLKLTLLVSDSSKSPVPISKTTFRFLKEELARVKLNSNQRRMIGKIENYFSKYSDLIHDKSTHDIQSISYLSAQISNVFLFSQLDMDIIREFNKYFYVVLFPLFNVNFYRLGSIERTRLKESVKIDKYDLIKNEFLNF